MSQYKSKEKFTDDDFEKWDEADIARLADFLRVFTDYRLKAEVGNSSSDYHLLKKESSVSQNDESRIMPDSGIDLPNTRTRAEDMFGQE